jgi:hypothetical protein
MVLITRNTNSGEKKSKLLSLKICFSLKFFFVGLLFVCFACLLCVCVFCFFDPVGFLLEEIGIPHFDCLFSLMSDHLLRASKFCFGCIDPFLGVVGFLCSWVCIADSGFWFCQSFRH